MTNDPKKASQTATPSFAARNTDELRGDVRAAMDGDGLSQNVAAREIGMSAATLSQWLGGEYAGNIDNVNLKIVAWLNARSAKRNLTAIMPAMPEWIETPTARAIYDAIVYAQAANDIAVIYGGAGFGKTATIRRYAKRNPNVFVVTATPATASVGVLLESIAIGVGLRNFALHPARLERLIVAEVGKTGGVIVIDEAQHLTKQALEAVRSIHDATGIGLVLAGNSSVYHNLYGKKDNGFAQLYSRVGKVVALLRPTAGDVRALARAFGVDGKAEFKILEDIARRQGALRGVVKTIRLATIMTKGGKVARAHIEAAWADLQGQTAIVDQIEEDAA